MIKFKLLWLVLVGMFYIAQGHGFTISTEFMDEKLIFRWSNISKQPNDIMVYTDGQQIAAQYIRTSDDQYIVENVMNHTTVRISIVEFTKPNNTEYMKTYAHNGKPEKPNITGDLEIKDGKNATLKCESKSTSAPDYHKFPLLSYTWFANGTRVDGEQSANYTFKVSKDDRYKGYSCQAKETLESERSDEIKINILYGPKSVSISPKPPNDTITIKDGDLGLYNCSADCNPPCTVQWKYKQPDGGFRDVIPYEISSSPLPYLNKDRNGMILMQCVANNSEGRKNYSIKLNILYLSKPVIFLNDSNLTRSNIKEGHTLNISCFVEGNPTPTIKLSKVSKRHTNEPRDKYWLNYTIAKAQCSDSGTYRCTGNTSQHGSKHEELTVNVTCEPQLDTSVSFKTTYGSLSGQNVTVLVDVPVIANPFPSTSQARISWKGPEHRDIINTIAERDHLIYKHWIKSTIPILDQRSFGNFTLTYNGTFIVNITINPEDVPESPSELSWSSSDIANINLTWKSNFNGGPKQFFILYRKEGSTWKKIANLTDPGEGNIGYYDLGPLNPGQHQYQLKSCNRINCSANPKIINVAVQALPTSSSQSEDNSMLVAIVSSAVGVVCIVILAVVMTMYFLRKKSAQNHKSEERNSGSLETDYTQPDVVVYAAVDKSVLKKNRQQDDVVKSDVIKDQNVENDTVYSEVIKPSRKQKQTNKKNGQKNDEKKEIKGKKEAPGGSNMDENTRAVNEDGLVYIDVEFTNKGFESDKRGKPVVHGEEERTEYTFVDFSKKAPPMEEPQDDAE
ncbi:uncharacterized protein LOC134264197 isoform X2 [Saccostrea cucullata]|uniref:uncharacterized protein LOC134264197 isoform X2 n=1 Tax=Saccostrea cuccullata TaxID=36930 RepID=UPI002ED29CC6